MIDVVEIKKAIKDKEIEFYIGGNRIYCRSDNGDTIQVLDLSEHDKQIRADERANTIDEMVNNLIRNSRTEVIDDEITLFVTERRIELVAKEMKRAIKGTKQRG